MSSVRGLSMIIYDLKTHFPPRAVEWLVTGLLTSWGAAVILQPGMFETNPAFLHMAKIAPQEAWGLYAFVVGALRAMALFINGSWQRTPIVRIIAAFASAFIWTQVLLGISNSPVPTTAWAFFPWFIAADFYSAFRAGADAVFAIQNKTLEMDRPTVTE